jgi:DEAD/DEAH box helicase domain-containing protein
LPTVFKKIRFETMENIGWGHIHLPELEMHTNAAWISFSAEWLNRFGRDVFQGALVGLSHLLRHAAPLLVLCDRADLSVVPKVKAPHNGLPTVFVYDKYPGGVGLSQKVYESMPELLGKAREMTAGCGCASGCPSCIGPVTEGAQAKRALLILLENANC